MEGSRRVVGRRMAEEGLEELEVTSGCSASDWAGR